MCDLFHIQTTPQIILNFGVITTAHISRSHTAAANTALSEKPLFTKGLASLDFPKAIASICSIYDLGVVPSSIL